MKRFAFIFAAFAACFAVSCNKEMPESVTTPTVQDGFKTVTITADIADADTKTSYDAEGKFSWTKGDQISVLASDNNFYTFTATETAATSTFTGQIPEDVTLGRFSYFPASENHTYDSATWYSYFSIDEYRDMNGLASADIPMYGLKGDDDSFSFTHLTGAIQLTFTNIPANINEVEISVKSASLKYSGLWKISTADWNWSAAVSEIDSELTYTRKVPVKNNTAQLYLPYKGQVWAASTINITGYDESENEIILLTDKALKGNSTAIERAQVVPYKTLELPDYVPPVDWDDPKIPSYDLPESASSSRQVLRKIQYCADVNKINIRLTASISYIESTSTEKLTFAFFDKTNGSGAGLWGWWNSAAGDVQYVAEGKATISNTELTVTISEGVETEIDTENNLVIWSFAIPRNTNEIFKNSVVYMGIMSQCGSDATGALPDKYGSMLEVTLP